MSFPLDNFAQIANQVLTNKKFQIAPVAMGMSGCVAAAIGWGGWSLLAGGAVPLDYAVSILYAVAGPSWSLWMLIYCVCSLIRVLHAMSPNAEPKSNFSGDRP